MRGSVCFSQGLLVGYNNRDEQRKKKEKAAKADDAQAQRRPSARCARGEIARVL